MEKFLVQENLTTLIYIENARSANYFLHCQECNTGPLERANGLLPACTSYITPDSEHVKRICSERVVRIYVVLKYTDANPIGGT